MKLIRVTLVVALALGLGTASAQSLGEAARKARKNKPAPSPAQKVYTNDNMPTSAPISIMSGSSSSSPTTPAAQTSESDKTPGSAEAGQGQQAKSDHDEWRSKVADQKAKIQLLERELEVLQREHQIQVSVFYADAGTRIRDDRKWADQDRKFKADIATKQQGLASAKTQLEDIREQARKAGVPASVVE